MGHKKTMKVHLKKFCGGFFVLKEKHPAIDHAVKVKCIKKN